MHMRNLECAIVVFTKLRGHFRCVGVVCALVAFSSFSMCSTFSAFVHFGDFCRGEGTQRRVLFKICLHIRFGVGVLVVGRCRAVGGSSDGGVKGKPLNNPLKTSVSRLLFCYYLTKRGFLQKSRQLQEWKCLDTSSFLLLWRMTKFVLIITPKKERLCQTSTQMLRSRLQ